jgi:hypothetical protein
MDQNGYLELVLYPSPISVFSAALLPFIKRKQTFLKIAKVFSLFIYWLENVVFLIGVSLQLLLLIPYNYFKTAFQVIRLSFTMVSQSDGPALPFQLSPRLLLVHLSVLSYLLPLWVTLGLPFLTFAFFKDLYNILKSLLASSQAELPGGLLASYASLPA